MNVVAVRLVSGTVKYNRMNRCQIKSEPKMSKYVLLPPGKIVNNLQLKRTKPAYPFRMFLQIIINIWVG